jgi:hypothetical protein
MIKFPFPDANVMGRKPRQKWVMGKICLEPEKGIRRHFISNS